MDTKPLNKQSSLLINGILQGIVSNNIRLGRKYIMGDEHTLLVGLHDLDAQIITKVHEIYFPTIYRYAHYRLGDTIIAEDLASETFIRLLEAVHAGNGPRTSLRGWLMGTISNIVNDYYRAAYNKPIEPLQEEALAHTGNPVSHSERSDQEAALRAALLKLTPDQQHIITLRFGTGCSLAETAEIVGKKPNAVKQLQFRALNSLRKHVEEEI